MLTVNAENATPDATPKFVWMRSASDWSQGGSAWLNDMYASSEVHSSEAKKTTSADACGSNGC